MSPPLSESAFPRLTKESAARYALPFPDMSTPPPPLSKPSTAAWPKTIGIIAIIFGVGGLAQGAFAPLSLILTRQQMQTFAGQGVEQARIDEYMAKLSSVSYLSLAGFIILALLLLAGGILLLKQRRIASPVLQTWAILKIIAGGFILFRTTSLTRLQMEIIMAPSLNSASKGTAGGAELEMVNQITSYATWIGLGFGFLWLAILPVFFIIWFNRRKVTDQMAAW